MNGMLGDELERIRTLVHQFKQGSLSSLTLEETCICMESAVNSVKEKWLAALFSGVADHTLSRYLNYHLEGIAKISDTLTTTGPAVDKGASQVFAVLEAAILALNEHLLEAYGRSLDHSISASHLYRDYQLSYLIPLVRELSDQVRQCDLPDAFKDILIVHLNKIGTSDPEINYSYQALAYHRHFVSSLHALFLDGDLNENALTELVVRVNFNALDIYTYQTCAYKSALAGSSGKKKMDRLTRELKAIEQIPEQLNMTYHEGWPSLKIMLSSFLTEEIRALTGRNDPLPDRSTEIEEKIPLNLSVAQLACLLRSMHEEGCFGELELQELFRFCARHFKTKRQDRISERSLSKEYYSIEQVTAAVMKDKLSKMIARLTQNFFPV